MSPYDTINTHPKEDEMSKPWTAVFSDWNGAVGTDVYRHVFATTDIDDAVDEIDPPDNRYELRLLISGHHVVENAKLVSE